MTIAQELRDIYSTAREAEWTSLQKDFRDRIMRALEQAATSGCNAIQITKRKAKDNQWDKESFVRDGFTIMDVGDTWVITFKSAEDGLRVWGGSRV